MEILLKDKVLIVTGSTQGVGEAIALEAARSQAKGICITGRNKERGQKVKDKINDMGVKAIFIPARLEDEEDCRNLFAEAEQAFGYVNCLANAAGLSDRGTIEDTPCSLWDKLFFVNARAPFILIQEMARHLEKLKKPASIVNIITISSHGGQPYISAYCSSKGALSVLTKNAAHALRQHRIRVNGVNIGWTDSPGEHKIQNKQGNSSHWLKVAEAKQPFGRLIKPEDIAPLVIYLLSDLSEMMTGSLIDFDQNIIGCYD